MCCVESCIVSCPISKIPFALGSPCKKIGEPLSVSTWEIHSAKTAFSFSISRRFVVIDSGILTSLEQGPPLMIGFVQPIIFALLKSLGVKIPASVTSKKFWWLEGKITFPYMATFTNIWF